MTMVDAVVLANTRVCVAGIQETVVCFCSPFVLNCAGPDLCTLAGEGLCSNVGDQDCWSTVPRCPGQRLLRKCQEKRKDCVMRMVCLHC